MASGFVTQDTVKPANVVRINTNNLIPDSIFRRLDEKPAFLRISDSAKLKKSFLRPAEERAVITDTISVCSRNSIADITFYDSTNFILEPGNHRMSDYVPFRFAGKEGSRPEHETILITDLKPGILLPEKPIHSDLIITIILLISFLFLLVRSTTRSIWPELVRYFMLRGIGDYSSRDMGTLFTWQSTIMNLISFLILSLFSFCATTFYGFIPESISPALFILASFFIIVLGITSRHLVCQVAGNLSGETDVFTEYLVTIYRSYRYSSILIFVLIVLLLYTNIFSPSIYIIAGLTTLCVFYFYRVLRLLLIFIRKDVSILYLILYLCALEILPVLILVKYFTGLL